MDKSIFRNRILPVFSAVIISAIITSFGFLTWHYSNPNYIILSEEDIAKHEGLKKFNPKYAITFDKNDVDYENINKYSEIRNILNTYFYKEVDANQMLEGAIAGMADSLSDPYTVYYTKEQMKEFNEKAHGSYVGIGVSVAMDNTGILTVMETFEGSPAGDVGIMMGDKIIAVDGEDVTNIRDDKIIVSMIKGKENTKVKITVLRPAQGTYLDFDVMRKEIKVINLNSEILQENIGYIKITMFDSEIAKDFGTHLNDLIKGGIKGLIIDLRDNPGGDYSEVSAIADRLLPEGLIVYTEDRMGNREEKRSDPQELDMPIAILVNEYSASASEVLSGAVKDHNKGKLIGTRTFGKGLVQAVIDLKDGSGVKLTVARYFTPSGECIHEKGIEPDIAVELDEKYQGYAISQVPREDDIQLDKAIEVIAEQIN
ncbi:MAG: S41 family peptidase [Clostridium sp.]|nr:S41 family peptidase [Clostridium sp.]